jgi:hypothetical protein
VVKLAARAAIAAVGELKSAAVEAAAAVQVPQTAAEAVRPPPPHLLCVSRRLRRRWCSMSPWLARLPQAAVKSAAAVRGPQVGVSTCLQQW